MPSLVYNMVMVFRAKAIADAVWEQRRSVPRCDSRQREIEMHPEDLKALKTPLMSYSCPRVFDPGLFSRSPCLFGMPIKTDPLVPPGDPIVHLAERELRLR